jgi:hypothetical protein
LGWTSLAASEPFARFIELTVKPATLRVACIATLSGLGAQRRCAAGSSDGESGEVAGLVEPLCRRRQRLLCVVISLGYGDRTLDCLLDAPLIRKIGTGVTVGEEYPRHAVRLNQNVDRRHAQ